MWLIYPGLCDAAATCTPRLATGLGCPATTGKARGHNLGIAVPADPDDAQALNRTKAPAGFKPIANTTGRDRSAPPPLANLTGVHVGPGQPAVIAMGNQNEVVVEFAVPAVDAVASQGAAVLFGVQVCAELGFLVN